MAKLCLNMIVRNESAIIERCLLAAAPFVDCYVIVDTGSTDDTIAIIERVMCDAGVPGEVARGEFHNFEQARNDALDAARASDFEFDYLLLCDADMDLRVEDPYFRDALEAPAYHLLQRNLGIGYLNMRIVRRDVPARYVGVTHEYLDLAGHQASSMGGVWFWDHAEGSSRSVKFERDIGLLTTALGAEPDNARYVFYLAQSYRDSGRLQESQETYRRRVAMDGWAEEVWYSLFEIAHLAEQLQQGDALIVDAYLTAYQYRPTRAEPLVALARYYRENGGRYALGCLMANQARRIARPDDLLFLDESAYGWRALDEYAIACYWTGQGAESARACRELLAGSLLPSSQRQRVRANLDHALALVPPAALPQQQVRHQASKAGRRKR